MEKSSLVWPPLCLGLLVILNSHPIPYLAFKNESNVCVFSLHVFVAALLSRALLKVSQLLCPALLRGSGHDSEFTALQLL